MANTQNIDSIKFNIDDIEKGLYFVEVYLE